MWILVAQCSTRWAIFKSISDSAMKHIPFFKKSKQKSYITWQLQILYYFSYIDMLYVFPKIKILF